MCYSWEVWQGCSVCFKTKRVSKELIPIFITFVPLFSIRILQGILGREASLWAECSHSVVFFFFTPRFCQASLIRGLSLAWHCCCKGLFMPSSLTLSLPPWSSSSAYNDGAQERKNIHCTQDRYFMQDDLEESAERKACQFKRSWLGDCSGMQDPHYGYSQGRPCILLRMNRVRQPSVNSVPWFILAQKTKEGASISRHTECYCTAETPRFHSEWHLVAMWGRGWSNMRPHQQRLSWFELNVSFIWNFTLESVLYLFYRS